MFELVLLIKGILVVFSKNLPKGEIEVPKIRQVSWLHFCILQTQTCVAMLCNMLDPMSVTSWTNMCCCQFRLYCEISESLIVLLLRVLCKPLLKEVKRAWEGCYL